jgi:hypothetical protein
MSTQVMITAGMCAVCKPTTGPVPFGVEFKGETNKTVSQDKWAPITYQEAVKNNVTLRIQQPPDGNLCEFDDEATREESGA